MICEALLRRRGLKSHSYSGPRGEAARANTICCQSLTIRRSCGAAALRVDQDDSGTGHNVAGLQCTQLAASADAFGADGACRRALFVNHFIDIRGAKCVQGLRILWATRVANVGVMDHEMRWLVFFVLGAGVVEVGELVEGELAVTFASPRRCSSGRRRRRVLQLAQFCVPRGGYRAWRPRRSDLLARCDEPRKAFPKP